MSTQNQMTMAELVATPVPKEKKPRCIRTDVAVAESRVIPVYAGKRVADALREVTEDMTLWKGARLAQVLEAVYDQGKKDGARDVFEKFDIAGQFLRSRTPHQNPGRPRKRR